MKQQIKYNNGSSNQPKYMTEEREIPMDFDGDKSPVANMGTSYTIWNFYEV